MNSNVFFIHMSMLDEIFLLSLVLVLHLSFTKKEVKNLSVFSESRKSLKE